MSAQPFLQRIDHVGELSSYPPGIEIDGRDDLQFRFLERAAGNAAADGPEAHHCDLDRQTRCLLPPPRKKNYFFSREFPGLGASGRL